MIRFDEGGRRFNCRIVGVAIHDGMVLLHRAGSEPFWDTPRGQRRDAWPEAAEQTIQARNAGRTVDRRGCASPAWLVENLFDYDGLSYHELDYFLTRFPRESKPLTQTAFESTDGDTTLQFKWFPFTRATRFWKG